MLIGMPAFHARCLSLSPGSVPDLSFLIMHTIEASGGDLVTHVRGLNGAPGHLKRKPADEVRCVFLPFK